MWKRSLPFTYLWLMLVTQPLSLQRGLEKYIPPCAQKEVKNTFQNNPKFPHLPLKGLLHRISTGPRWRRYGATGWFFCWRISMWRTIKQRGEKLTSGNIPSDVLDLVVWSYLWASGLWEILQSTFFLEALCTGFLFLVITSFLRNTMVIKKPLHFWILEYFLFLSTRCTFLF